MPNQYINKVIYGDQTLLDISSDTVTANTLLSGYTAHSGNGANITGAIATRTASDIGPILNCVVTVPTGYYNNVEKILTSAQLTTPESGTNEFTMTLPNGEDDPVTLYFSVDSEGNSNVTDDFVIIMAEEVSF